MELIPVSRGDLTYLKSLYFSAFPKNERKPFFFLLWKARQKQMDLLLIQENGENVGLTITGMYRDMVLIDYFAIDPARQGSGLGSLAIPLWKNRYPGKRIFLEIERLDENAPNIAQRVRRKRFYLKNGLRETGLFVDLFGVPMEILSLCGPLTFAEYHSVYARIMGPFSRLVRPLAVGNQN